MTEQKYYSIFSWLIILSITWFPQNQSADLKLKFILDHGPLALRHISSRKRFTELTKSVIIPKPNNLWYPSNHSRRNLLISHSSLVRSCLPSISVADNNFDTSPMENTPRVSHYLSPAVTLVMLQGTHPQIEQCVNRNSSPQCFFHIRLKPQRN